MWSGAPYIPWRVRGWGDASALTSTLGWDGGWGTRQEGEVRSSARFLIVLVALEPKERLRPLLVGLRPLVLRAELGLATLEHFGK